MSRGLGLTLVILFLAAGFPFAQTPTLEPPQTPELTRDQLTALNAKARAGDVAAEDQLADYYFTSKTAQDFNQARDWSLKAANQGSATSARRLGVLYEMGAGVSKDEVQAFKWFLKAANLDDVYSEMVVAKMYERGEGPDPSPSESAKWTQKAALRGDPFAQDSWGLDLINGTGVAPDTSQGLAFLLLGAQGSAKARLDLARLYEQGVVVDRDPVQAFAWALVATAPAVDLNPAKANELQATIDAFGQGLTDYEKKDAEAGSQELLRRLRDGDSQPVDLALTYTAAPPQELPMEDGHFLIPVKINDDPDLYYLLVDSGASISAIDKRLASKWHLHGELKIPIQGSGETVALGTIAENIKLNLPGLTIGNARMALLPDFELDQVLGHACAGIIGFDLLRHTVVRLNYLHKTVEMLDPDSFSDTTSLRLPLEIVRNQPKINISLVNGPVMVTGSFLVDSGNNGGVQLGPDFPKKHPEFTLSDTHHGMFRGLGGNATFLAGTCDQFKVGNLTLSSPNVLLLNQCPVTTGIVGTEIWGRFNLTLDAPHGALFLSPNQSFNLPFTHPNADSEGGSGVGIKATSPTFRTYVVYAVVPGGAGQKAGVLVGDVLAQIDGKNTQDMDFESAKYSLGAGVKQFGVYRNGLHLDLKVP